MSPISKLKQKSDELKDTIPFDLFDMDRDKLDQYSLEQSKIVLTWGIKLADARDTSDRAEAALDVAKAEARNEITNNPTEWGLTKTTVDQITSAVNLHPDVTAAQDKVSKAKHDVEILKAMMVALEHRKSTIEGMIKLHGQQYFSVPQRGYEASRQEETEQVRQRINRKLNG